MANMGGSRAIASTLAGSQAIASTMAGSQAVASTMAGSEALASTMAGSRPVTTTRGAIKGGYALWQYTAGNWVLKKDECEEGYECGAPPQEPGSYEGEVRKTAGVPRGGRGSAAE